MLQLWLAIHIFEIRTLKLFKFKFKFKVKFKRNSNLGQINNFSWVLLSCKFEELFSCLKSAPSNLLDCKVLCKNPQIWEWSLNKLFIYSKPTPLNLSIQCFVPNKKFSCLGLRYLICVFCTLTLKNKIIMFEISTFDFAEMQSFMKKWKLLNLGPKMREFFLSRNFKSYCHIWHQDSWISQMEKFVEGIKKS